MDPRMTARPKVKPKPDTDRPTGIAGLAAWLATLPLPTAKTRQDRREAWLARRAARAGTDATATPIAELVEAPSRRQPARQQAPARTATAPGRAPRTARPPASSLPVVPPPPADALPDLAALVAAGDAPSTPVPAWVTAEAPRMLFEMPGPGEAVEGAEFFRLFRQNADGLAELAGLAGDSPTGADAPPAERPWWRFAAR